MMPLLAIYDGNFAHSRDGLLRHVASALDRQAMAVGAAYDDAARFKRSSSAAAYLGLVPRHYESGEISRNDRIPKYGDAFTRNYLFEASNAIFCRNLGGNRLLKWAKAIAERAGPKKAKVALARMLEVTLNAKWRSGTPFQKGAVT